MPLKVVTGTGTNITTSSISIGVHSGSISGIVSHIRVVVPWRKLYTEKISVHVSGVSLVTESTSLSVSGECFGSGIGLT